MVKKNGIKKTKRRKNIPSGSEVIWRDFEYYCPVRGLVKETVKGYKVPSISFPEKMRWTLETIYKEDQELITECEFNN